MSNLPEPVPPRSLVVRHPSVVRAAVSPSAIAVTAAGVVIGLLAQGFVLAVVLGVGAWFVRMLVAVIVQLNKERNARPTPAALDPWSVPEPWRQLVQQALSAQTRFDQTIEEWPEGPLRDRLVALQPRLWAGMEQVGAVATRGAALSGWSAGVAVPGRPSTSDLTEQLRDLDRQRQQLGDRSPQRDATLARTQEAVAAQLRAVRNAEEAAAMTLDRLRLLVARLDEAVTSLLALGIDGTETGADILEATLGELTDEISALHGGLAEASRTALPPPAPPKP